MEIGKYNRLTVSRAVDFGVYLRDGDGNEVLLPSRYITGVPQEGDEMDVFVYTDSEDRPVATTEQPLIEVGCFALLRARQVNNIGAFLDWGLPKDLLVPFSEQKVRMQPGRSYIVYAYLDHATRRVVASAKIEKFVGNKIARYKRGETVTAMVYHKADIGYKVIVDNLYQGIIYYNETFRDLSVGEELTAYVKSVRDDNKIDLTLSGYAGDRIGRLSSSVMEALEAAGGSLNMGDGSSPEEIKARFECSKKDFKKAVGHLLKEGKITATKDRIALKG
ncbi:MAG: S1-like domain-containing RNA-binding protein [Pseudoflavonifractor sp.]|nr:S1-like domain-containing RNA-binding protein [Pseudoflavonifractor sp.]